MLKVKIDDPSLVDKVWVTSDLHLLHQNISGPARSTWKDGYRDFEDEFKMTDYLINTINQYVPHDGVLIHCGDFAFKDHKRIPELRSRIACKTIHVLEGNHDNHLSKYASSFTSFSDKLELNYFGKMFICDHYAHRVWLGSHQGYYHLYGHSHNMLDIAPNEPWGKSMDVGVDAAKYILGDYRPFNVKEVISILDQRDTKFVDGHKADTNVH